MRRTMIFRSSCALAVMALSLFGVRAVHAQDDPAPAQGRAHIVESGETLWDLAQQYFGDPFLWPSIYPLNTIVVEDPHWIFPGEELMLVPPEPTAMVAAEPEAPVEISAGEPVDPQPEVALVTPEEPLELGPTGDLPPPPPPTSGVSGPTVFMDQRSQGSRVGRMGETGYRSVLPGQFYAAGFLTERDRLPWSSVVGALDRTTLGTLSTVTTARIFGSVELRAPALAVYHVGDTLLTVRRGRDIDGWGRVIVPSGLIRVTDVAGSRVTGDVVAQFHRVISGQSALPVEPFSDPGTVEPVPIENGMTGSVIAVRDLHPVPGKLNVIFIDLGREQGVAIGDIFEVLQPPDAGASTEAPPRAIAIIQVVHVRQRSASGLLLQIFNLGVRRGAPVRLSRKMPS